MENETLMDVYGSNHSHENDENRVVGCAACNERARDEYMAQRQEDQDDMSHMAGRY